MRVDSEDLDSIVTGTTVGDRLEAWVWRDGELAVDHALSISDWSTDWDAGRQVQGQVSLTVADPDGTLAPWGLADALAPGGSRLQLTYISSPGGQDPIRVPLGWWRIREADPHEEWRVYSNGSGLVRVAGGGTVSVTADEETSTALLARLDAEVVQGPTVVQEVRRLLTDVCPVVAHPDVVDGPVQSGYVYDESRMDGVDDLLSMIDAEYRMAGDGSLEIVPSAGVGPVWTIEGGEGGAQIETVRALSDSGVYNAVVATGEDADGLPLVGRAYITDGPLAWGGPFGQVPLFHKAVGKSAGAVQREAESVLANRRASGEVDLDVTCLTHPGLQVHDLVTVAATTTAGVHPLVGRVVQMKMVSVAGSGSTPSKSMKLVVRVPAGSLEAVAWAVRRG
ncbi:hypothetical protein [Cellulosimicrobium cellulans]|uniref:hypothetical protein n=1 Tax=Cellulosimicrobium cellulans TaxID=1710 RepID=UPI003C32D4B7